MPTLLRAVPQSLHLQNGVLGSVAQSYRENYTREYRRSPRRSARPVLRSRVTAAASGAWPLLYSALEVGRVAGRGEVEKAPGTGPKMLTGPVGSKRRHGRQALP